MKHLKNFRQLNESYYAALGGASPLTQESFEKRVVEPNLGEFVGPYISYGGDLQEDAPKLIEFLYDRYSDGKIISLQGRPITDFSSYGMRNGDNGFKQIHKSGLQGYANISPDGQVINGSFFVDGTLSGGIYISKSLHEEFESNKGKYKGDYYDRERTHR